MNLYPALSHGWLLIRPIPASQLITNEGMPHLGSLTLTGAFQNPEQRSLWYFRVSSNHHFGTTALGSAFTLTDVQITPILAALRFPGIDELRNGLVIMISRHWIGAPCPSVSLSMEGLGLRFRWFCALSGWCQQRQTKRLLLCFLLL